MADTIKTQILANLKAAIEGVTEANGYNRTIRKASRRAKALITPQRDLVYIASQYQDKGRKLLNNKVEVVLHVDLVCIVEEMEDPVKAVDNIAADIEKAICDEFGLEPATLQSGRKAKRVSHPRMLAMWLARKHTRAALSEIGRYFGRRSHSTVISAQKRVDGWMANGHSLELAEGTWDVDEAIRRVERRLRAG